MSLVNITEFEDSLSEEYRKVSLNSNYFHSKTYDVDQEISFPISFQSSMRTKSIRFLSDVNVKISIDGSSEFLCPAKKVQYFNVSPNSKITSFEKISIQNASYPVVKPIINVVEYDSNARPSFDVSSTFYASSYQVFTEYLNLDEINPDYIFTNEIDTNGSLVVGNINSVDGTKNFQLLMNEDSGQLSVYEIGVGVESDPNVWVIQNSETSDYFSIQVDNNGILSLKEVTISSAEEGVTTTQFIKYFNSTTRKIRVVTNSDNVYAMVVNRNENAPDLFLLPKFQIHEFKVSPNHQNLVISYR
jgi:hypothetical protein